MAIEDLNSPAWLEYQNRRRQEQERSRSAAGLYATQVDSDCRVPLSNQGFNGCLAPEHTESRSSKGFGDDACTEVELMAAEQQGSVLQRAPKNTGTMSAPPAPLQTRGVKRKQGGEPHSHHEQEPEPRQVLDGAGSLAERAGSVRPTLARKERSNQAAPFRGFPENANNGDVEVVAADGGRLQQVCENTAADSPRSTPIQRWGGERKQDDQECSSSKQAPVPRRAPDNDVSSDDGGDGSERRPVGVAPATFKAAITNQRFLQPHVFENTAADLPRGTLIRRRSVKRKEDGRGRFSKQVPASSQASDGTRDGSVPVLGHCSCSSGELPRAQQAHANAAKESLRRGVERKQEDRERSPSKQVLVQHHAHTLSQPSVSGPSSDERGDSGKPADKRKERSSEGGTSGSPDFRNDAVATAAALNGNSRQQVSGPGADSSSSSSSGAHPSASSDADCADVQLDDDERAAALDAGHSRQHQACIFSRAPDNAEFPDERGVSVRPTDDGEGRTDESQPTASFKGFRDDASVRSGEGPMAAAQDGGVQQQVFDPRAHTSGPSSSGTTPSASNCAIETDDNERAGTIEADHLQHGQDPDQHSGKPSPERSASVLVAESQETCAHQTASKERIDDSEGHGACCEDACAAAHGVDPTPQVLFQHQASTTTRASDSGPSSDERGDSVQLADNREERSSETGTSGSLADFRDDATTPQDGAMFHAAFDNARAAALDAGARLPPRHPLDEDFLGQLWFYKKAAAVQHQQANRHALIASCDLSASGGYKKFSSFADAGAFVSYLERLRAEGVDLNHYECVDADTPSKFYVDVDYVAGERNDEDFRERFEQCVIVLRGFLEQVLLVPSEAVAFQVATAHGERRNGGYKYSAHVCLQGFYLKDASVRGELKRALLFFLEKSPPQLRRSCEFLFYHETKEGVSVEKCLIDTAVYSSFQNWRTLHSEKKGSDRPLKPAVGSSRDIADHLIGFHDPADRAAAMELDGDLLAAYNQRAAPLASGSRGAVGGPARGVRGTFVERGAALHPLTGVEKDRLLRRYQKDHPGAWILQAKAMGEDVFTVHFGVPAPYCWIAGRAHSSPGNVCGYLVYSRKTPSRAFYRCHSSSCSGATAEGNSRRLQRVLQLDAECIESWSSDYEIVGRMEEYPIPNLRRDAEPQTTLVMANMGAGKSKELFHGLLPRLPPEASVCLIAPNIALARKYHEETKKEGLDYVCYLDEPGGKIAARRVVVCINSIARVLPRFDLVVMDEVNFTLTNMASTVMKDKKRVFMALEGIVAGAKAAFLSDAHLNCPRVIEWIQTLRHASCFYTIRNRGVWPSERKAVISPMPGPLVGRGQPEATYSLVVKRILDLVASGKTVMVPATSKTFVELLERAFEARLPGKKLIAFHGDKREESDKMLLQHAISNPDEALIADCLAFTPTIGPGVSIEKKGSYDLVIGVAVNSDNHPDAQVLMQQIQRARDAGDIQIFYAELPSRRRVAHPNTKEEVFRMLESSDRQLADLMQGVSVDHLDMLRAAPGERAIYDRSSATCNLYANNVLGRLQSRLYYVYLLTEDLRRQGVTVVNRLSMWTEGEAAESVLVANGQPLDETVDQWRERHLISWEQYERIRGMLSSLSGGVTSQDVLRYEIFNAAVYCYGIKYRNVDREFMEVYVRGKRAESLMTKFGNYERFVTSNYASTVNTLSAAVQQGQETGNIQDYLEIRNRPANGVNYAWCVLAALAGVPAEEIDNTVFRSFEIVAGNAGGERLSEVFDMDDFNMARSIETLEALYRPRTSLVGKNLSETQKRNVIKMILEGGLGLTLRLACFSHGVRRGSHKIVPMQNWKVLDEQYGGLKERLVEKRRLTTCLVEMDE